MTFVYLEVFSIVTVQPIHGADPQKAFFVGEDAENRVLRQPILGADVFEFQYILCQGGGTQC